MSTFRLKFAHKFIIQSYNQAVKPDCSAHETYSAIEQLNKTASGLEEEVSRFRIN